MLPRLDETRAADAERRLAAAQEIWLTTVRPDGQPQSSPVGFLWDGERFLVISQPGAPKVRNLRQNPRAALHLEQRRDGDDAGVLTLEGTATVESGTLGPEERAAYLEKYADVVRDAGYTPDSLFAEYSAVLRVQPTRARSY
jgi:PPOX class probable F420-dependent enzyme